MAKKEYISRFLMIVKRIKKGDYPSYEILSDYIQRETEYLDDDFYIGFSKRTLQRDIREIRAIFGIDICYSRAEKGYFIDTEISENLSFNEMLETYDVLQLFKTQQRTKEYLFFEQKQPKGTTYLNGILYAIEHRKKLKINYEKFLEAYVSERVILPYALKERNNRWYVIAKNEQQQLRTFALDRFRSFKVLENHFVYPTDLDIDKLYEFNYGISIDKDLSVKKIVFKTNIIQAKYLNSLPLHHTQKTEKETEDEVQFSVQLKLGDELIYKLLSFGERITVLEPQELINTLKEKIEEMKKKYT